MKQSVTQIVDFFKKHKYGKASMVVLAIAVLITGASLLRSQPDGEPIPLSDVAADISAGRIERVEDSPNSGLVTHFYTNDTQHTTLRDTAAPFLEQMRLLGVDEEKLANLQYEIKEPDALTGGRGADIFMSLMMMGLTGPFACSTAKSPPTNQSSTDAKGGHSSFPQGCAGAELRGALGNRAGPPSPVLS